MSWPGTPATQRISDVHKGFSGELFFPTIHPESTENILFSFFECRDREVFFQKMFAVLFRMQEEVHGTTLSVEYQIFCCIRGKYNIFLGNIWFECKFDLLVVL